MVKVLIAPTAFKNSLSPLQVAEAIEQGVRQAMSDADIVITPMADGGDGTIEAMHRALGGELHEEQVQGPLSNCVSTEWLRWGNKALCELASSCGLARLPDGRLDALNAHTSGLGQLIVRALQSGCSEINIALGGSASTDGGMGALRALGAVFFDQDGHEITASGGASLTSISKCDLSAVRRAVGDAKVKLLCDIDNPLLGPSGAAAIFAPQKGATSEQVALLEKGLNNFAEIMERACGRSQLRHLPGSGAAGGTAFGLMAGLNAELCSGFDWMAESTRLVDQIEQCDLIITGEGRFDLQSLGGKGVGKLVDRCRQKNKQIIVVSGCAPDFSNTSHNSLSIVVPSTTSPTGYCNNSEITAAVAQALDLSSPRTIA